MNRPAPSAVLGLFATSLLLGACDVQAQRAAAAEGTFERTLQVGGTTEVRVVDALPRTASMKVNQPQLRELFGWADDR